MPSPNLSVRPTGGKVIHLTREGAALLGRTFCGRPCSGWHPVREKATCNACLHTVRQLRR